MLITNLVRTPSGHIGSIDGELLKGQIKTIGAVYHAHTLAKLARSYGMDVVHDKRTGVQHGSQRYQRKHERRFLAGLKKLRLQQGILQHETAQDWNALTSEQQSAMVKTAAAKGRAAKDKNTIESSGG